MNSSQLCLSYPGRDKTLKVELTDVNGVLTDCLIRTKEADESTLNMHFRDFSIKNKVILKVKFKI